EMSEYPGKMRGEALMKQVRRYVDETEPELIIEVDSDHFVNFFYNNLPSFCIGMAEEAQGPQETWCPMPRYTVREHVPLAKTLFRQDRKSTRLNSSHVAISYAVFCLKKKNT